MLGLIQTATSVTIYQILSHCLLFKGNGKKKVWHEGVWNESLDNHSIPRSYLLEIPCVSAKNET